ncbi:hypothetical protein [Culturomica massiliensis]|uniref:hypothetical protein n=1 Tax=Culturomica massiliensis TaxID=1841857 RepID=UPI002664F80C|nr:hypothetical protein [Culturomica massiliensis]
MAEYMPKKVKIKILDLKTYYPIKNYYRIKVGIIMVGGFSVPDGEDFLIYFTPFKHRIPVGEKTKVENTEQLGQFIKNQQ